MADAPLVRSGSVVVLRFHDIAYGIDLTRAEVLAAAPIGPGGVSRSQLTRTEPKAMVFGSPPVQLGLGRVELPADGGARVAEASGRAYDFGVVSLALRFPVTGMSWPEFVAFTNQVARAAAAPAARSIWEGLLERVGGVMGPALNRPSRSSLEEDYLLAIVNAWDRPLDAEQVMRDVDLAPLISGEDRELSDGARLELLRHRFSYYRRDLAVLTSDRAFLAEPEGDTDVAEVLQMANAQLLELLYYDARLDEELPRMYDRVQGARLGLRTLARRRYADLAREYYTLVAEVTEVTEKVDSAVKVVEDVYLARVYTAALDLFRVQAWEAAVDRKLAIVRDTYTALYDEETASRAELLELAIVLLIVFEIVMAFWL